MRGHSWATLRWQSPPAKLGVTSARRGFLGKGMDVPEPKALITKTAFLLQGETGYPGLPGCKGLPGFDVSRFLPGHPRLSSRESELPQLSL